MTKQIRNPNDEGLTGPPKRTRWGIVGVVLAMGVVCRIAVGANGQREVIPGNLEGAVERGLSYLAKQQKIDGAFEGEGYSNAVAGLGVMAFLAGGHMPDVGKFGVNVRRGVDYLLKVDPEGGYYGRDGGRMLGHAMVTVALAEVYGTEADPRQRERVRLALERALRVIFAAQDVKKERDAAGGWSYEPEATESDLPVTGWCVMALRACQNAGLVVPKQRVDRAAGYVARCFRAEQGGFADRPDGDVTVGMTGAGVLSLYLMDAGDREEAALGVRLLEKRGMARGDAGWYFGMYAVAQGGYQAGGATWPVVWKRVSEQLLSRQRPDGAWEGRDDEVKGKGGRVYATAMACLALEVPMRVLPVYQR